MATIDRFGREIVLCKWCGEGPLILGMQKSKMCNRCYELNSCIQEDPVMARKILESVEEMCSEAEVPTAPPDTTGG